MRYAGFLHGIVFFGLILSEYGIHLCFHDVLLFFYISDVRSNRSSLWKLHKKKTTYAMLSKRPADARNTIA